MTEAQKAEHARLMSLPVDNPERPKLRDRVPFSGKTLEQRARKFLTRSEWCNTPGRHLQTPKAPVYPAWTYYRTAPATVLIPDARDAATMQTYIRKFDRLNGLRSIKQED